MNKCRFCGAECPPTKKRGWGRGGGGARKYCGERCKDKANRDTAKLKKKIRPTYGQLAFGGQP